MSVGLVQSRNGPFLYQDNDIYIGRSLQFYGEYSQAELSFISQLLGPGDTAIDAGANIGTMAIPLAKLVGPKGSVLAFEPQRLVYNVLCGNIALNQLENLHALNMAVGATPGTTRVPQIPYAAQYNRGGIKIDSESGEVVPLVTIDNVVTFRRLDLLMADVEGYEEAVLRGAEQTIRTFKPVLYLENNLREKSPSLLGYIFSLGYQVWWHLPALYNPNNHFQKAENIFGNILSVNIVCMHKDRLRPVDGLRKVQGPDDWWK